MSRKIIRQVNFSTGSVTPRIYARTDTLEYQKGLEVAENAFLAPHGPIIRRSGSEFIAEIKDSSAAVRLGRYQVTSSLAFILEFGNNYIRFFKEGGQVIESDLTITDITQANPAVVTSASHGLSNGDYIYITDVLGMTQINSLTISYKIANVTANTFELQDVDGNNINSTSYTAYSSGGVANRIFQITSPWSTSEVADLQYVQKGLTMYIVHPSYAPRTLIYTDDTTWTLATLDLQPPPTYESGFVNTGVTVTPSATSGTDVTFTASAAVFLGGDAGRQIVNLSDGETGRASIVSVTSSTVAVCDIIESFTDTNAIASADWKIDLSPVVDLEVDAVQAGSIANLRSEYVAGSLGDRVSITGVTKANPAVVTATGHGLSNGDKIQIQDIVGMTQINNKEFTIDGVSGATFQLKGEDSTNYTTYSSGGIIRKILDDIALDAFRSDDVGKYILMNGGVMQIITVNSATDVDAEIIKSLNSADTSGQWTLETETWTSARGYPRAVGLYEERLVFAGTDAQPQNLWFSEVSIFEGFGVGPDDEDSIDVELVSNRISQINWIAAGRDLVIGSAGEEITVNSGSNAAFSSTTIQQTPRTAHGSNIQQISSVRDEILFLQASGRKVRTFRYDYNIDGYTGEDLTFLAEHLTEGGLKELVYVQEPDTSIYVITNDGDMVVGTYDRIKSVIGWSKYTTDGSYENIMTIQRGEVDEPWVVVKRLVNGATKRYIELFVIGDGTDDTDGFSDSYLTLSNPVAITGITNANPAVVTAASHGFSNGNSIIIKDLVDPARSDLDTTKTNISDLNQEIYIVANKTANTFELTDSNGNNIDLTDYNAYGSSGNVFKRVTSLSGLNHLEGKIVQVKGDGAVQPTQTVSSGAITAASAAGEFVVGLPYTTTITTLHIDYDIGLGSMLGQRTRWARPLLQVYRSGRPLINGEYLPARNSSDKLDVRVPLYSGILEYGPLNWDTSSALTLTITDPLPLQLTGIFGIINGEVK